VAERISAKFIALHRQEYVVAPEILELMVRLEEALGGTAEIFLSPL
jgi:hypothetical protein